MNISVAVDVFNGLANIRRLHRANLDLLAKKYQLEDMKEDISLLVANSYLQILFNKEQLDVQKSQLKMSQEELKNAKEKFNNGVIPEGNLFEIEANLALSEQNVIMAENGYQLSKLSLSQLLMFGDSDNFDIADDNYEIPKTDILNKDAKEILEEAMKNRNDIKLAETNLEIAIKDQQISKSALLPSASAFYSYNSRVIMDAPTSLKSQFDLNAGESIGLQLNIPIINGWSSRAGIKKSKLNVLRSKNLLDQTKMDLENTIYQALNDAKGAMKSYEAAKKSEIARKTAYEYAKERFENGALNTINYFQAQQLFETAQSELIKAKYDYIFKIKVLEFYWNTRFFIIMDVKKVAAKDIRPLRNLVLRPNLPIETTYYDLDDDIDTFHLASIMDNTIISIGTFYPENDIELQTKKGYRLRGMATHPKFRRKSAATKLMEESFVLLKEKKM